MTGLAFDVRHAVRGIRRALPVAVAIVACLGFGIGSVTLVYSWQLGLVRDPLPAVVRTDELVTIRAQAANGSIFASHAEYLDWRDQARTVSGLTACSLYLFGVAVAGAATAVPEPVYGMFVSASYFDVLGVQVPLGRSFRFEDDQPGNDHLVAIVSHRFWRSRLARNDDAIGQSLRVNGQPVTILGVAAPGFGGTVAGASFDLWIPISAHPTLVGDGEPLQARANRWLDVLGRRRPGVSLGAVQDEFAAIGRRMAGTYVESQGRTIQVGPLDTGSAEQLRPLFASLLGLTTIVLLLVCSNVANMLLLRGSARATEISVRFALGATRAVVVRLLMIENLVLAVAGALAGVGFAWWGRTAFNRLLPPTTIPLDVPTRIDGPVIGFAAVVTAVTVVAFGLMPAITTSHLRIAGALRGLSGATVSRGRLRGALVAAQLALCLATLVSAALFLRRAEYVKHLDRGFVDPGSVVLVQTEAALAGYSDLKRWQQTLDAVAAEVAAIPGVRSTTWATFVPLGYVGYVRRDVEVEGYEPRPDESMRVLVNGVGPQYFELLGAPMRQGREFTAADRPGEPPVAIVNEAFARRFWPNATPIGRTLAFGARRMTVVGVARDSRYDYRVVDGPPAPFVYYALAQAPARFVTLHVRTDAAPPAIIPVIRSAISRIDAQFATLAPVTLEAYTDAPLLPTDMALKFLGLLGLAALAISAMGLQAIVAYGVAVRTREIGIRLALGASAPQVVGIFLRQTAALTIGGVAGGLACTAATVLLLRHQMPHVSSVDPATVIWPCTLLVGSACGAGYWAARRATRVDPARTLRAE